MLGFGGMFGACTYIAYTLTEVSGFDATAVPWLLVLFGAGLFLGNALGGTPRRPLEVDRTLLRVPRRSPRGGSWLFTVTAANPWSTAVLLFLMGGFGFEQ